MWEVDYDIELSKTSNITAYDNKKLVACLRILSESHYFGTITELTVDQFYEKNGCQKVCNHILLIKGKS